MVSNLVKDISENNKIYISYDDLNKTPLLSILFTPVTAVETFSDYLINVLQELNKAVEGGKLKVESGKFYAAGRRSKLSKQLSTK